MTLHHAAETIVAVALLSLGLGIIALVAVGACGRLDPLWRSAIFGTIILCSLAAPVVLMWRAAAEHPGTMPQSKEVSSPVMWIRIPQSHPVPSNGPIPAALPPLPEETRGGSEIPASWRTPLIIAGIIWAAGIFLGLVYWAISLFRLERIRRKAVRRFQIRNVPVLESGSWDQPACAGAIRPWILLPAGMAAKLGPKRLRAVLLHESAHARHRDILWLHLQRLARVLHWWNPGIHLVSRAFSLAREELCDRRVLAAGISPPDYAQYLLDAARQAAGRTLPASAGASASFTEARKRIQTLMKTPASLSLPGKGSRIITTILTTGGLIAAFALPARFAISAEPDVPPPAAETTPGQTTGPVSDPTAAVSKTTEAGPAKVSFGSLSISVSANESMFSPDGSTHTGDVIIRLDDKMELRAEKAMFTADQLIAEHPVEFRMDSGARLVSRVGGSITIRPGKNIELKNCELHLAGGSRMRTESGKIEFADTPAAGKVSIMGEVTKAGRYDLQADAPTTLLDAIAEAGGLTQFASPGKVKILRGDKVTGVYDLEKLTQDPALNPKLLSGDIIIVPLE